MSQPKCPFSMVQAAGAAHCRHALEVIRRGGSEFDCREPRAQAVCAALVEHLNAVALPALGYADDLTQTPKSIYERIMLGGLDGLRGAHPPAGDADIWAVVDHARAEYGALERIPDSDFVPAIEACSLRKRRGKRR
jgi:hypothetical protein